MEVPLTINPSLHGPWTTALREKASVVWATTWEGMANKVLAPLLGIQPLPVALRSEEFMLKFSQSPMDWKAYTLERMFTERDVCWVDDQNRRFNGNLIFPNYLVVTTDPAAGLTKGRMSLIDRWVAETLLNKGS